MNDMSSVIVAKSDQINADDLIAGPRIVTIAGVKIRPGTEQPVEMALEGTDKLFRPCKTVSRVIVALWGADANQYIGKSLRLFRDPTVTWAGVKVGGIRIDHASHIDAERTLVVKESQKASKVHKIKPLKVEQQQSAPARQTAAEWAASHIEAVRAATDADALATIQSAGKKAVDKIAGADTNLHRQITDAYGEKLETFNPSAQEGAADADTGERTDTTDLIAMYEAARTQDDIARADKAANAMALSDDADVEIARTAAVERL